MSTLTVEKSTLAKAVSFDEDKMTITLQDGRLLGVPLEWFAKLRDADPKDLLDWRFIGDGEGIHWEELDEDILVENLL